MGHESTGRHRALRATLGAFAAAAFLLASVPAQAAPVHVRKEALDVTGLNHACGAAVDSKGDFYASSAGTSEVKVYDAAHTLLTSISDTHEPCGLAVTTTGNLYVSEKATGEVVRFKPNAYPFVGTPTYGPREVIDPSGVAKGIAVDRFDNFLYVAEGTKVAIYKADGSFEANVGEGKLTEATGVAAYTYSGAGNTNRYLWVADAAGVGADRLYLFAGAEANALAYRRELTGATTPDGSFGFGAAGAYLAADPGNRVGEKCVAVSGQACSAGNLFLYDAEHKALDEFDASGEYLDRTAYPGFADAEPTAVAIDRSGGANDGTLYVTAGAGAGAKALAFAPLSAPSRKTLKKPSEEAGGLSQELEGARAVATDSHGDVYAGAETDIHVYGPDGKAITTIEGEHRHEDIAVDSTGNVYVLDRGLALNEKEEEIKGVTYYTPSKYPPDSKTTYLLHEPPIATEEDFPAKEGLLRAIAVIPGPSPGQDRLLVTTTSITRLYGSAVKGSTLLDSEFAKGLIVGLRQSLAVNGATGTVYIATNSQGIYAVDETGKERLAHFDIKGSPSGKGGANPNIAVDQSSGHVIEYDGQTGSAHEYDAAGGFLAEFGAFTENAKPNRVALDNACATHEPPLSETTEPTCKQFDPANGTAYVAYDDSKESHPPYDVSAFGPLDYGTAPPPAKYKLTLNKSGTGSGKVTSSPAGIDCGATCSAEYEEGTEVTLSATASEESEFIGWSGSGCSGTGVCKVEMTEAREVVAEFKSTATEEFPLEVIIEGPGSGNVTSSPAGISCPSTCTANFGKGVNVSLTAFPASDSKFSGWEVTGSPGACPGKGSCEVAVTEAKKVKASFAFQTPLLSVVKEGTGTGKVTSSPAGIDCGLACAAEFELGKEVTLEAKAEGSSEFAGWEVTGSPGACAGKGTCKVTMSEAREAKASFTALPQAIAKPALPVSYHEATLRGEADPAQLASEYHFEYLSEAEYEANGETFAGAKSTPVGVLGAAKGLFAVQAPLTGLKEGTKYRFRLVVEDTVGTATGEGSFETLQRRAPETCPNGEYRFGLSANLPDCRAYELVTPAQTDGLLPYAAGSGGTASGTFSNWLTVPRGEGVGERLSYFTDGTLPGFEGNGRLDGYRAERGAGDHPPGGWQSALFSPDYTQSAPGINLLPSQHGVASDQLYSIWEIKPEPETFPETLAKGLYLSTPTGFEVLGQGSLGVDLEAISRYLSPGGAHAIFISNEHLEAKAAPQGTATIYDRAAGKSSSEVVSVKPDDSAFNGGEGATYLAASEDGSAVVFRVGGTLYLRHEGQTFGVATSPNTFAGVSEDGRHVFYAATANGASAASLYLCDTEAGPCTGTGAHAPAKIASAGIFVNVSPAGSHAFFSSTEALTGGEENENGEEAEAGKRNLYSWDGGTTRFVARLAAEDFEQNAFGGPSGANLAAWTSAIGGSRAGTLSPTRSIPGGGAFVFQSHARLTTYDNTEASAAACGDPKKAGDRCGEIYRYEPAAEAGERLLCVSCDPSGAPPSANALLADIRDFLGDPINPSTLIANLSDDGKTAFFQSLDQLLPEDANESEDVYEWEAKGTGGCSRLSGCLALISSGQGEVPSFLYSMSADGRDVFIHTKEKLVGMDVEGSPSIYDARVGGGIPEPTPPAPCQGDACQGVGALPPALPSPASIGGGEGGEASSPPSSSCAKGKHRVKGRCVAAKHHKNKKRHRKANSKRGGKR
jgi:hypothetical protein